MNTFDQLIPDLYAAIDTVSRELTGFIPAVSRDSRADRAALNQVVRVPVTTAESSRAITPGPTVPDDGDTTVNSRPVSITKSEAVPIRFTGEEIRGLDTAGTYADIRQDRIAQGMRSLVNEIETDVGLLILGASGAYGTAGTAPFGTKDDFTDFAGVSQILDENGAPPTNRQLVAGSSAWFNLRGTQTGVLQRANEAGTAAALREGEFGQVHGMALRNSAGVASHDSDVATGYLTNSASLAEGDTAIPVDGTTTGDLLAGDIITFAGDTNNYVITAGSSGAGTITIAEPGLKTAVADNSAITVGASYVGNAAFHRSAIVLATRAPALPDEGDMAIDRTTVTDPMTGLSFDFASYPGYHNIHYEVGLAWGQALTKAEHAAILLG